MFFSLLTQVANNIIQNNGVGSVIFPNGDVPAGNVELCSDFSNLDHYTFASGVLASQHDDISGYDRHWVAAGGSEGSYTTGLINGKAGLVLGVGKGMQSGAVGDYPFLQDGTACAIYEVLRRDSVDADQCDYLNSFNGGSVNGIVIAGIAGSANIYVHRRSLVGAGTLDNNYQTGANTFTGGVFHKLAITLRGIAVTGDDDSIYIDDLDTASATDELSALTDSGDTQYPLTMGGTGNTAYATCFRIIFTYTGSQATIDANIIADKNKVKTYILSEYGI
jgi:hypothetical protein